MILIVFLRVRNWREKTFDDLQKFELHEIRAG
jgi:hypothetical protein